jgi:outer membrane protein OmpA-like peptidoglycan-associated protein
MPITLTPAKDGDYLKDLLYDDAGPITATAPYSAVNFDFEHLLAKAQFVVTSTTEGGYYYNVEDIKIQNIHTGAVYTIGTIVDGKDNGTWAGTLSANYGLINTFRVAKRWAINLELAGAFFRNGFSSIPGWSGHDMMWNATVGVTYRIGKVGWEPAVDVAKLQEGYNRLYDGLNNQLEDALAENKALKGKLAKVSGDLENALKRLNENANKVEGGVNVKESIFFAFDSYKIASKKEELNIKDYAEAAAAAGKSLIVRGYADKTGNAEYNKKLSQRRADAVADLLEQYGATVEVKIGEGVSEAESARFLNRRVTIEVAE